jgi:hypothetical protein
MLFTARVFAVATLTIAYAAPASAQQSASPAAPPAAQPQTWDQLPRMQLERQFAGPLKDTIVQRWRDPGDGTICYIYLPITAPHSPPVPGSYVQYGPNAIGSISCLSGGAPSAQTAAGRPAVATTPAPTAIGPATNASKRP